MTTLYQSGTPKMGWPVFDAIYPNAKAMKIASDNILIGSFVLVKYSDNVIAQNRRLELDGGAEPDPNNNDEKEYKENLIEDGGISKDRIVYQKQTIQGEDGTYSPIYTEICRLNEAGVAAAYQQIKDEFMGQPGAWLSQLHWNDTNLLEEE